MRRTLLNDIGFQKFLSYQRFLIKSLLVKKDKHYLK